jgi:hypothetical protein
VAAELRVDVLQVLTTVRGLIRHTCPIASAFRPVASSAEDTRLAASGRSGSPPLLALGSKSRGLHRRSVDTRVVQRHENRLQ